MPYSIIDIKQLIECGEYINKPAFVSTKTFFRFICNKLVRYAQMREGGLLGHKIPPTAALPLNGITCLPSIQVALPLQERMACETNYVCKIVALLGNFD